MAEAEGIPPTASVASVGPGIRYAGKWVYAYSGLIAIGQASPETSMLNFETGSGIIKGTIQAAQGNERSDNDMRFTISFNGDIVAQLLHGGDTQYWAGSFDNGMLIIVPPFTTINITGYNLTSGTTRDSVATLTGRVYDA